MTGWNAGYVTEVDYGYGYHSELVPHNLALAALSKDVVAPGLDGGPLRVLELGCGQGYSANLIAAANPHIDYTAIDFSPSQIAGARALAAAAGTPNIRFSEAAFDEFAEDRTVGEFDVVTLHGIYSWISATNRAHIVRIAREKLRPGGLLYLSYNCYPGWAPSIPVARLFADVAAGAPQEPIARRIDQSFKVLKLLTELGARYLTANPDVIERFDKLEALPRNYLAHEFLNENWTVFHSADVSRDLAAAKLTFVASAQILDHLDALNLTDMQQHVLSQVRDPIRKEAFRDLIVNQDFRRDVYVKGTHEPPTSLGERWHDVRLVLSTRAADIALKAKGLLAEAVLSPATYGPILERLEAGPATVRALLAEPRIATLGWTNLRQHLLVLIAQGTCHVALPAADEEARRGRTDAFNRAVLMYARHGPRLGCLASPVTGAGVTVDRLGQLALLAAQEKVADRVAFISDVLDDETTPSQTRPLVLDRRHTDICAALDEFDAKVLPILKRLKIA